MSQGNRWLVSCCRAMLLMMIALPVLAQDKVAGLSDQEAEERQPTEEELAAEQAALESELASAKRFEAELDALLLPNGQLDTTADDAKIKLNSLATRCGILANSALHDEVKLLLLGYQARALAALSSLDPAGQNLDRIEQLNDVTQQIAAIDLPGAAAASDYWLLVAEMAQLASSKLSPTKRQVGLERVLTRFIKKHGEDEAASEYLIDTRLILVQLMDQRGAQRGAAEQLAQVGELPEDSPRLEEVNRLRESIARVGTPIAFESISTQLMEWSSSDHLGKPVLIHIYADRVAPSVRMIDAISRRIVGGSLSGIALVSLRVGEPVAGSSAPPWPTLPVQLERGGILDQLGVSALPTLAWLDSEGRLASIGTTASVLDQLDALKAEPEENEEVEEAEIEPGDEEDPALDTSGEEAGADEVKPES